MSSITAKTEAKPTHFFHFDEYPLLFLCFFNKRNYAVVSVQEAFCKRSLKRRIPPCPIDRDTAQ